ncbi:hypothetical protein [Paenibacillus polymyxa]|uniref:hypothetical protein n=1 Tax=Paenibacillus polymyxa TaxID=1406 RepID=UPI002AB5AD47|nr:hypothetical protein [Paenibacillus polymyxa]MDY8021149.1 hypothetical protein [Paenibacillus polymyxa]
MAKMTQYEKGYSEGKLDAAENELYMLYRIKEQSGEQIHESSALLVRIKETEEYLLENGRDIDIEEDDNVYDEDM